MAAAKKHDPHKAFRTFLVNAGAEMLEPTNEWEVLRFRANGGVGIVYTNSRGGLTFTGVAIEANEAFKGNKPWQAVDKKKRKRNNVIIETLLKRDGNECFYCGKAIEQGKETLEHIFSLKHGGTNHVENLALCHKECNQAADSMHVVGKIKLREKMRSAPAMVSEGFGDSNVLAIRSKK